MLATTSRSPAARSRASASGTSAKTLKRSESSRIPVISAGSAAAQHRIGRQRPAQHLGTARVQLGDALHVDALVHVPAVVGDLRRERLGGLRLGHLYAEPLRE